jgi:beta-glucosidase-like glycosyl hydrolase
MKKKYILSAVILIAGIGAVLCASGPGSKRMNDEASAIVKTMTLDQKIGQLVMTGVHGSALDDTTKVILNKVRPGGVILFGHNLSGKSGTTNFIDQMQNESVVPLFVSIDQEGGRVKRITDGVTQFPGAMAWGSADDPDASRDAARIIGIQLRMIGVNMNLAPVMDVNNNPDNPVINTRSFGSSPGIVSKIGGAYIEGMLASGCIPVAKHFPGHGDTNKDSHITLPVIPFDIERLRRIEFVPFAAAVKSGVECIMTAHISFPKIIGDSSPATVSKLFLTDILRGELGFGGTVITDDLEMNAVSGTAGIGKGAVQSIAAGADIVLISSCGQNMLEMVKSLREAAEKGIISAEKLDRSVERIIEMKLRYNIMKVREGRISRGDNPHGESGLEAVSRASDVNRLLSRKSICASKWGKSVNDAVIDEGKGLLLVTHSNTLRKEVKERFRRVIFVGADALFKIKNKNSQKGPVVLFHVDSVNEARLRGIVRHSKKNSINLCVISTGNPFPVSKIAGDFPVMYSFSNTSESLRQIAAALGGEFIPKDWANLNPDLKPAAR